MLRYTLATVCFFLLMCGAALADVRLYLYSRIDPKPEGLMMKDIALIEGNPALLQHVREIVLPGEIYDDGIIDRKEILELLKGNVAGTVMVYGSGVSLISAGEMRDGLKRSPAGAVVKKGSPVKLLVRKGGITIEVMGTALKDGDIGETIPVRVKKSHVADGKIVNNSIVEIML